MKAKHDVMQQLAEARPVELDPVPDAGRRQVDLARAFAEPLPTRADGGAPWLGGRRTRSAPRMVLGVAVAATVATVAVVTVTGALGPPSPSAPTTRTAIGTGADGRQVELSAAQILLVAADQVTTSAPASGRYWRTTTDLSSLELAGPDGDPYVIRYTQREQSWAARSDSRTSWAASKGLGREPATAADRAAWQRDGSPTTFEVGGDGQLPGAPTAWTVDPVNPDSEIFFVGHDLSMTDVRALPADPTALRAFLLTDLQRNQEVRGLSKDVGGAKKRVAPTQDSWLFSTASGLLTLPVSAEVRACAYRIMAGLDGVRSLGSVRDVTGRTGNAVAVQGTDERGTFEKRIIIDPRSGLLLAEETRYVEPGSQLSWLKPTDVVAGRVIKDIGWTDDTPPARTKYVPSDDAVG